MEAGADRILLDNMGPEQLREAVSVIAGKADAEASGGIDLETIWRAHAYDRGTNSCHWAR